MRPSTVTSLISDTTLAALTRRGGGNGAAVGLGGSGAFLVSAGFFPLTTGVSAKMSPVGRATLRWRAMRSTNWRATTSSIVLEALFTSMPWSRLSSAVTLTVVGPVESRRIPSFTVDVAVLAFQGALGEFG